MSVAWASEPSTSTAPSSTAENVFGIGGSLLVMNRADLTQAGPSGQENIPSARCSTTWNALRARSRCWRVLPLCDGRVVLHFVAAELRAVAVRSAEAQHDADVARESVARGAFKRGSTTASPCHHRGHQA